MSGRVSPTTSGAMGTGEADSLQTYADGFYKFLLDGMYLSEPRNRGLLCKLYEMLYHPEGNTDIPKFSEVVKHMKENGWIKQSQTNRQDVAMDTVPNGDRGSAEMTGGTPVASVNPYIRLNVDQHVVNRNMANRIPVSQLVPNSLVCPLCEYTAPNPQAYREHRSSRDHRVLYLLQWYQANRKDLTSSKHGLVVRVTKPEEWTKIDDKSPLEALLSKDDRLELNLHLYNGSKDAVILRCIDWILVPKGIQLGVEDEHGVSEERKFCKILPDNTYNLTISCSSEMNAAYTAVLSCQFKVDGSNTMFHVVREMIFRVQTDLDLLSYLMPKTPFQRNPCLDIQQPAQECIPAPQNKFKRAAGLERELKLSSYQIPNVLSRVLNHGLKEFRGIKGEDATYLKEVNGILKTGVTAGNHKSFFKLMLHIEEQQMKVDIRQFDLQAVTMEKDKQYLRLEVPGLAENRPSVLRGDSVYVRAVNKAEAEVKEYEGKVMDILDTAVLLEFNKSLMERYMKKMKFNVRFTFNRHPLCCQHRAAEMAMELSLDALLFPTLEGIAFQAPLEDIKKPLALYNTLLSTNPQQITAVKHILAGSSRPAPYIIFGPPGTGKTVTIVEAIKQVWHAYPNTHILVCAPSNAASDLLAQRLLYHVPASQMLRMHAPSRSWRTVPDDVKKCSNFSNGEYNFPKKSTLAQYRIIITTLVTAGRLASANFPTRHFTHVFVDESGQALEPELLVGVAGILEPLQIDQSGLGGQLVLAGDPKQLGPVLRSPIVLAHGLGISYLERLMNANDVYQRVTYKRDQRAVEGYNEKVITKLVQNFRSHPALLELNSRLFYDGELQAHADKIVTYSMCKWDHLPTKDFPIIFHSVQGKDTREGNSPSFFNPEEVMEVMNYVKLITQDRFLGAKLPPKEIGIISPYRRQVQKIQLALNRLRLQDMTVGSTEQFQGQERRVIIVSTVRSNPEWLTLDSKHALGFLQNPKRFNVALTRAKSLLIVIGNPTILCRDVHWRAFLQYVMDRGGYKGPKFNVGATAHLLNDDLVERFNKMKMGNFEESGMQASIPEQVENPQWRNEV